MNLEDWRSEIDDIDQQIVRLLHCRARIVRKIGTIKAGSGLPSRDPAREDIVLKGIARGELEGLPASAVTNIFSEILRESRNLQDSVKAELELSGVNAR